jgi:hypothetical protein
LRGADEFASSAAFGENGVYLRVHVSKIRMFEERGYFVRMPKANVLRTRVYDEG